MIKQADFVKTAEVLTLFYLRSMIAAGVELGLDEKLVKILSYQAVVGATNAAQNNEDTLTQLITKVLSSEQELISVAALNNMNLNEQANLLISGYFQEVLGSND